jgi:hypothetical protein
MVSGDSRCATGDRSAAGVDRSASRAGGLDSLEAPSRAVASYAAITTTGVIVFAVDDALSPDLSGDICGENAVSKEFTEPVALLSTRPADVPLPRTAAGLSFNLLALRARCVEEPMVGRRLRQAANPANSRSLRSFLVQPCRASRSVLRNEHTFLSAAAHASHTATALR